MNRNRYTTICLPSPLVEELKVWKTAYCAAYGRPVSYAEMIRSLLDYIPETEPDVEQVLEKICDRRPELLEKLGRWGGKKTEV